MDADGYMPHDKEIERFVNNRDYTMELQYINESLKKENAELKSKLDEAVAVLIFMQNQIRENRVALESINWKPVGGFWSGKIEKVLEKIRTQEIKP